jgi:hypothetical protein
MAATDRGQDISCSGSECKELLASLGRGEVAPALDDPALLGAQDAESVRRGAPR